VIGTNLAMLGSANMTNMGVLGRTEMSVLIDDPVMVAELCAWFNTLWEQTHPPIADETNAFIQCLDEEAKRASSRRERFTLSSSRKKTRARLVELHPQSKPVADGAPLNLDVLAQALVVQEQRHYKSLEDALASAINDLAIEGFLFGQIVERVRQTFSSASVREIYFCLLGHCANHVRSVFTDGTINRLILSVGRFSQSIKEHIPNALAPFDFFLVHLVRHFDFIQARDMPDEVSIKDITGFHGGDQIILINELLECGFLEIEDVAGRLPQYILSEGFEWIGRYKLFATALHDWNAKKQLHKAQVITLSVAFKPKADTGQSLPNLPVIDAEKPLSTYTERVKRKDGLVDLERKKQDADIEKLLSYLIPKLLSGEVIYSTEEAAMQISNELGVRSGLVRSLFFGGGRDVPKKIFSLTDGVVSLNSNLNLGELYYYPQAYKLCETFLEL
jgi:hypothetical protein